MSKVACETAAALPNSNDGAGAVQLCSPSGAGSAASPRADDAAESVLVPVPGGVGLTHLFGAALRRDGSTNGGSNPKAAAEAATRKGTPRAGSRRLTATSAAAASKTAVVIGVLLASKVVAPATGRVVVARAWRRPAAGARVFASEAVGPEPVSPKVSCFGAVLSERSSAAAPPCTREEEEGGGCWASMATVLCGLFRSSDIAREAHLCASEPSSKATTAPEPQRVDVMSPPRPVVGLGDVKRLASRRWPETMAAEGGGAF